MSENKKAAPDGYGNPLCSTHVKGTEIPQNNQARYTKPESVKTLETLAFKEKERRYTEKHPGIATYFLLPEKYRDDTANGLTKCVIDYIRLRGGQAERISTTGRVISSRRKVTNIGGAVRTIGSTQWIPGTSTNGSADISATINGQSVKIEVKIGRDTQSDKQKAYQESIERAGGIYCIARDFTTFKAWFDAKFGRHE